MSDTYEIRKGIPAPPSGKYKTGMTNTLRKMERLDSIIVPSSKRGSVYACAAQAGIQVQTQSNSDGSSITVWRLDERTAPITQVILSADELHSQVLTPEGGFPTGSYRQDYPYGPNIFYPDLDETGRPINLNEKPGAKPPAPTSSPAPAPTPASIPTPAPDPAPDPASPPAPTSTPASAPLTTLKSIFD